MRIDYFIVSEKMKDRIVACEMHGQGIELQGSGTIPSVCDFNNMLAIMLKAKKSTCSLCYEKIKSGVHVQCNRNVMLG